MEHLRPLPIDIQTLDESEKACEYCGVSYLLLNKYNQMTIFIEDLESQLGELQVYKEERESVLKGLDEAKERMENSESETRSLRRQLEAVQFQLDERTSESNELNWKLTNEKKETHRLKDEFLRVMDVLSSYKRDIREFKQAVGAQLSSVDFQCVNFFINLRY